MVKHGFTVFLVGMGLLAAGMLAMFLPVQVDGYDPWGFQVECGNGFSTDLGQATTADEANARKSNADSDFAGDCGTAVALRRAWAIPAAVLGWLALTWLAIRVVLTERHPAVPAETAQPS